MHNDLDADLSRIAERAGSTARLRPVAQIRARGDRRRVGHRVGTAALSAGALGLTAVGAAAVVGNGGLGGEGTPIATSPPTPQPPVVSHLNRNMLLTTNDLNKFGNGWREETTDKVDDGKFLRCQQGTLASLGASEALVRTFTRPGSGGGESTSAGQLIAYFPISASATEAHGTLFEWLENCSEYSTEIGGEPHWVGGGLVSDTVQAHGADPPPTVGAAWQHRFDDNVDDQNAWFDSIGVGAIAQPYLTIVTYGDWGQDANYLPEDNPGVVLLQDAFAKLPS